LHRITKPAALVKSVASARP